MRSQTHEGGSKARKPECSVIVSPVTPTECFRVEGMVSGERILFLLDTGAAVTLLRKDTWSRINARRPRELESWSEQQLVGVDGASLQVHGQAKIRVELGGVVMPTDVIVVSPLTTEAILGLDFLRLHEATINVKKKQLRLGDHGPMLALGERQRSTGEKRPRVRARETIELPPCSEVEVIAHVEPPIEGGTWLMEGMQEKRGAACVARALVTPNSDRVRIRLLNPRNEAVKVYRRSEVATLELIDEPSLPEAGISGVTAEPVSPEKQELLERMVEEAGTDLNPSEKSEFLQLLLAYLGIFSHTDTDLGRTKKLQHEIATGDATPIRQHVRRIPPVRRQEVQQLLSEMLEKDVIQQSTSPWSSPIVLVKKKDGTTRFCVDFRKLNTVTRKDAYPLPRIDATLDTLAGSQCFSTLDLLSGYWQVEMAEGDRQKTAFCTTEGLFEFKVMPFGLCNAPATFQRLMDLVLAGLQWSCCLVYIDDVIILGRSFSEHLRNCGRLQHRSEKSSSSWGFASYYRRFIEGFAQVAKPLHCLTERKRQFQWTEECQAAFEELRHRLTTAPVLAYPDFEKSFILDTDASDVGIGAVLSQVSHNGQENVITYASRLLSKTERRYCVTRRELLAVVAFTKQFRHYLLGKPFLLRTDHGSLTWLKNFKEPEGQLARWLERLEEFDFEITHRQGKRHTNADALSRLPCRQCGRDSHYPVLIAAAPLIPTKQRATEVREAQLKDATIGPVLQAREVNERPSTEEMKSASWDTRRLVQLWDQLQVREGYFTGFTSTQPSKHQHCSWLRQQH